MEDKRIQLSTEVKKKIDVTFIADEWKATLQRKKLREFKKKLHKCPEGSLMFKKEKIKLAVMIQQKMKRVVAAEPTSGDVWQQDFNSLHEAVMLYMDQTINLNDLQEEFEEDSNTHLSAVTADGKIEELGKPIEEKKEEPVPPNAGTEF